MDNQPIKKVLNVGGGANRILPEHYKGWEQHVLDIDELVNPDICCDAKELQTMDIYYNSYDAVYCSHNLEHYYKHDVPLVLEGFRQVLNDAGIVEIHVPNLKHLFNEVINRFLDVDDVWYRVNDTPITFHDALYGWNVAMSQGNLYYAHKCGFTPISLANTLQRAGFHNIQTSEQGANLLAVAWKSKQP